MRRREFIAGLGSAAAWPVVARAQKGAPPTIGYLCGQAIGQADNLRAFRLGLKDAGYVEGENVAIEYRFADNQMDRLPAHAADLVRRRVAVIVAASAPVAVAAAKATSRRLHWPHPQGWPQNDCRVRFPPCAVWRGHCQITLALAPSRLKSDRSDSIAP